jgi:ligand-binding sensor domain-containing protein
MLLATAGLGQKSNYYQKIFSIRDGLPNNHVQCIAQDKTGFLWIGTWDGLARYDGSEFKIYRHNPDDSSSLVYFDINMIIVDSGNNVWIRGGDHLCRYQRNHDNFRHYNRKDFNDTNSDGRPASFDAMVLDQAGNLVIRTDNNLFRFDPHKEKFIKLSIPAAGFDIVDYYNFYFDQKGFLWLINTWHPGDYGTVLKCAPGDSSTYYIQDTVFIYQNFIKYYIACLRIYNNVSGHTWITSNQGLYLLEKDTFQLFHRNIPPGEFREEDAVLWSDPGYGLFVYYPQEESQDTIFKPDKNEILLSYYFDNQHNIWFSQSGTGLINSGLGMIYRTGMYFKHYLTTDNSSGSYAIYALLKDKAGNIWAGGHPNDHLVKIAPDGKMMKIPAPYPHADRNYTPRNMAEDDGGNIWFTCYSSGLYSLNPETGEFTDRSNLPVFKQFPEVYRRFRLVRYLGNDRMAITGGEKITILNLADDTGISLMMPDRSDPFSVYPDQSGNIWLGLKNDIVRTTVDLDNIESFHITDITYNIEDICPGDSVDLWLALLGGGICHYNPGTQTRTLYTTFNGLAHNTVYNILKDRSGNLWISHDLGISMFNPSTKSFTNFNDKDGLQIREFDSEAAFQTPDGEMLFGGLGGIVSFFPDSVKRSRLESPDDLIISEFRVSNEIFLTGVPIHELRSVKLQKGTDNFQVEFVRPDFRYQDEMRYRYMLKGSRPDWTLTDSRHRRINFTSLRPGNYEFIVESTGLSGEWKYRTSLVIEIPKYYYQTLFFKILLVLLSLGILLIFFMMKLKQTRLKEKKKQEQLKLETLRGQMNPHFIYNSLNSINYFISSNDRMNANQYITDFSRLMRSIMSNSSQDYITLESEIQTIRDYLALEHLRFSDKFDYEIIIDENIDQITTEIIPSLVQPFIENAIWHGLRYLEERRGFLSVRFQLENDSSLVCYIEDDGIGRRQSVKLKTGEQKKRRSRGIAIVEERLAIINSFQKSRFTVQVSNLFNDRDETGTRVRIEIPFKKP